MKIGIVTTFSDNGYTEYARHFVESCKKFLDKDITVYFYIDNVELSAESNFVVRKLEPSIPELTAFKQRNANREVESFLHDGVRFSHKSYCMYHCANNTDVDVLFWLDSDTEIFEHITKEYLLNMLPAGKFCCYLGRQHIDPFYTETGFLGFDLRNPSAKEFFEVFKELYDSDKLYSLDGQLDCHVFDAAREQLEREGKIINHNLGINYKKNHFNNVFVNHMIHYKGPRKQKRDGQLAMALQGKTKIL